MLFMMKALAVFFVLCGVFSFFIPDTDRFRTQPGLQKTCRGELSGGEKTMGGGQHPPGKYNRAAGLFLIHAMSSLQKKRL